MKESSEENIKESAETPARPMKEGEEEEEEEIVCLDASFFINDDYQMTTFTFGSHSLQLLCLQCASTDFDLTGQLVWPGATLLNNYLSENAEMLRGCSVLELGSGIGVTGILCSRFCKRVVLTDHNDEVIKILKKNVDIQSSSENPDCCAELLAEKLDWGNSDQVNQILQRSNGGFDLILGADICFQQSSIPLLFDTVEQLLRFQRGKSRFILAYISRAKVMDSLVVKEATQHGLKVHEVAGTRSIVRNHEGMIFDISLL
ncbi:Protein N-lysine methyltransferase METTL21A [Linum grandiflorum]